MNLWVIPAPSRPFSGPPDRAKATSHWRSPASSMAKSSTAILCSCTGASTLVPQRYRWPSVGRFPITLSMHANPIRFSQPAIIFGWSGRSLQIFPRKVSCRLWRAARDFTSGHCSRACSPVRSADKYMRADLLRRRNAAAWVFVQDLTDARLRGSPPHPPKRHQ